MAYVGSFYIDSNLENDASVQPKTINDLAEAQFVADIPLNDDAITRIIGSQLAFEKNNKVASESSNAQQNLENPNFGAMNSSILDNHKYFAPPNSESSQYAWNPTEAVSSHHQYVAQSPNIYTNDYMTSEPSDYVYM